MSTDTPRKSRASVLPPLDRRVLLGFVVTLLIVFFAMWLASADFMAGARMFPRFVGIIGLLASAAALWRVWTGKEPMDGVGQTLPGADEQTHESYVKALKLLAGIALYYVGILLVGFLIASAAYLIVFARCYREPFRQSVIVAVICVSIVYVLDKTFELFLPKGLLLAALF